MKKPDSAADLNFITAVVFIAGSVLMTMEIAGSRVLAPHFGGTIFVWASLISVFLAALACGYFLGGGLADRHPSRTVWGGLLGAAGVFVFLVPFIGRWANPFLVNIRVGDQAGPLLASLIIFFIPSLLLGMVSPFAVKFCVRDVSSVGNTTGRLYAVSAAGNILGTLLTAFLLINIVSVPYIFVLSGLVLAALALLVFIGEKKRALSLLCYLFFGVSVAASYRGIPGTFAPEPPQTVVFQQDSFYNQVTVLEDLPAGIRKLAFDGNYGQTGVYLSGDHASPYPTTDMMRLPLAFVPEMRRVLFLGCGGGVAPRNFHDDYPGLQVDVVEIDPLVVRVSKDYFFFEEKAGLKVHIADARRFLRETEQTYDIIFLDVFNSAGRVPFHLLTKEFFKELEGKLAPGGAVAVNFISLEGGVANKLFLALYKTLGKVFKNVYAVPNVLPDPQRNFYKRMNIFLLATRTGETLNQDQVYLRLKALVDSGKVRIKGFEEYARVTHTVMPAFLRRVPVLRDDFSPAELLYLQRIKI